MFKDNYNKNLNPTNSRPVLYSTRIERLTALWALSESALGGVLHALRFPFRGMIISSAAIVLISMIAQFSRSRGQILKSTILVIAAKALISPHTPVTALFSVLIQGLLGEVFLFTRRSRFILTLAFGITVSLLNSFQKILVLTVVFGASLWSTVNDFINYIVEEWFFINTPEHTNFSFIIISIYVGIHLLIGFLAGLLAWRIPKVVTAKLSDQDNWLSITEAGIFEKKTHRGRRHKFFKPASIIIFLMGITIIVISYIFPVTDRFNVLDIIIMISRSILIMILWYYFISPIIRTLITKKLTGKKDGYAKEVNAVVTVLPSVKSIVYSVWKSSSKYKGFSRVYNFVIYSIVYLLADQKNQQQSS